MDAEAMRDEHREQAVVAARIAARIEGAVAAADFRDLPVPDFSAVIPDVRQLLSDAAGRSGIDDTTRKQFVDALAELPIIHGTGKTS